MNAIEDVEITEKEVRILMLKIKCMRELKEYVRKEKAKASYLRYRRTSEYYKQYNRERHYFKYHNRPDFREKELERCKKYQLAKKEKKEAEKANVVVM